MMFLTAAMEVEMSLQALKLTLQQAIEEHGRALDLLKNVLPL